MGGAVAHGMAWMLVNTVVSRSFSFAAQIVLGWMLAEGDFGLYAIAISVAGLVQVLRDGGLRELLIQRGREFPELKGPIFWLSLTFNFAACAMLAAAAPIAEKLYEVPSLAQLLWVIAACIPLSTPAIISHAKLTVDLNFRTLSGISMVSALLRHALTISFALLGFGPMSFVLPLLFIALYEGAAGIVATREIPWRQAPRFRQWRGLLSQAKWIMAGSFSSMLIVSGDYLVLGWIEDAAIVGVYFFAFQLSAQVHMLLLGNLQSVLFPSLARIHEDTARLAAAFSRALATMAVIIFPVTFLLGLIAAPLESMIWRGRWADAVPVVQILCLALPLRSITAATKSLLDARGRFLTYFITGGLDGVANMTAAAIGGFMGGLRSISVAIAIYMTVSGIGQAAVAAAQLGASPLAFLRGQFRPAAGALIAGGLAWVTQYMVLSQLIPLLNLVATSAVFSIAYAIMAIVLVPDHVAELKSLLVRVTKKASVMKTKPMHSPR